MNKELKPIIYKVYIISCDSYAPKKYFIVASKFSEERIWKELTYGYNYFNYCPLTNTIDIVKDIQNNKKFSIDVHKETFCIKEAYTTEKELIKKYDSFNNGYNMCKESVMLRLV